MITGAGGEGTNGNRLVHRASVFSLEMRGKSAVSSPPHSKLVSRLPRLPEHQDGGAGHLST